MRYLSLVLNAGSSSIKFSLYETGPSRALALGRTAASMASAPGRACVHDALRWLGVELDADANRADGPRISGEASRISVWVVLTDENLMIAQHTRAVLDRHAG